MHKNIDELIAAGLSDSISFDEYFGAIENGMEGDSMYSEESLNRYTELNFHRMKRLNKTASISEDLVRKAAEIKCRLIWLTLTEGWCGDAAQIIPILHKLSIEVENIDLRMVYRDQNLELMDQFLTNGGRSIPKIIVIEQDSLQVIGSWGPRPKPAQDIFRVYKNNELQMTYADFQVELQKWYAKDKAKHIQQELADLLECRPTD